jgi:hypothetical protein
MLKELASEVICDKNNDVMVPWGFHTCHVKMSLQIHKRVAFHIKIWLKIELQTITGSLNNPQEVEK